MPRRADVLDLAFDLGQRLFGIFARQRKPALIQQFGATDAALIDYVVPVMATAGGLTLLDERLTGSMVIGMVIILLYMHRANGPVVAPLTFTAETCPVPLITNSMSTILRPALRWRSSICSRSTT